MAKFEANLIPAEHFFHLHLNLLRRQQIDILYIHVPQFVLGPTIKGRRRLIGIQDGTVLRGDE